MWIDRAAALAVIWVLALVTWVVYGFASGRFLTTRIYHAGNSTDCVIVYSGGRVAVDCFVVEGEHVHELVERQ